MKSKRLKTFRPYISVVLLVIAISAGIYYVLSHHSLVKRLKQTPISVSISIFILYIVMLVVLMIILTASLKICRKKIKFVENGMLNINSLLINFFIPGQGGPAYRGVYLNRRHKINPKQYIFVTLLYYAMYALISTGFLLLATTFWWLFIFAFFVVIGVSAFVILNYRKKAKLNNDNLDLSVKAISFLFMATLCQVVLQTIIYAIELHNVDHGVHVKQVITYTGAANLALFVSLTPGAIGIRETFLIFTRHLHHISSSDIIVANVIDRSVYLALLIALAAIMMAIKFKSLRRNRTTSTV